MKKDIVWKLFFYLIIYSFLGFIIETLYALITAGVLESRRSFIYGPFCIVYGFAAIVLIMILEKYKNQNITLFICGMILGSGIEYFASIIGEIFLHAIWWDYSNEFLNLSGRTCLYYSLMWGILSIILINYLNPLINHIYNSINKNKNLKRVRIIISFIIVFFIFDSCLTCFALENFLINVSNEQDIEIKGITKNFDNDFLSKHFTNDRMLLIYPNIIVLNKNNEIIYLKSIMNDVKNYYYKF